MTYSTLAYASFLTMSSLYVYKPTIFRRSPFERWTPISGGEIEILMQGWFITKSRILVPLPRGVRFIFHYVHETFGATACRSRDSATLESMKASLNDEHYLVRCGAVRCRRSIKRTGSLWLSVSSSPAQAIWRYHAVLQRDSEFVDRSMVAVGFCVLNAFQKNKYGNRCVIAFRMFTNVKIPSACHTLACSMYAIIQRSAHCYSNGLFHILWNDFPVRFLIRILYVIGFAPCQLFKVGWNPLK